MRTPQWKMETRQPASCSHNVHVARLRDYPGLILLGDELTGFQGAWHEAFQREAPLHVEIGCGKGEFLVAMAARHPEVNFFGWEITYKKVVTLAEKARRHGLTNIRLTLAHAQFMQQIFGGGEVAAIYVNFPDPWQKAKERKNRLFQPAFVDQLHHCLMDSGMLLYKTDHQEYFHSTRRLFGQDGRFVERYATEDLHRSDRAVSNIQTNFERLFTAQGLPTYYLELEKSRP